MSPMGRRERRHLAHLMPGDPVPPVPFAVMSPKMNIARVMDAIGRRRCPTCGAGPGERCVTRSGNVAYSFHAAR